MVKEELFYPMPSAPTYFEKPGGGPVSQIIPIRMMWQNQPGFAEAVDLKMSFTEIAADAGDDMADCLKLVGDSETTFLIWVTVKLQGTSSIHMHDFIYKRLSWCSEDEPALSPKEEN